MRILASELHNIENCESDEQRPFAAALGKNIPHVKKTGHFVIQKINKLERKVTYVVSIMLAERTPLVQIPWLQQVVYVPSSSSPENSELAKSDCQCQEPGATCFTIDERRAESTCIICGLVRAHQDNARQALDNVFSGNSVKKTTATPFTYRPQSHFANWLARIQGKEDVNIPQNVMDYVGDYFKAYNIDPNMATVDTVRNILKKEKKKGFSAYYSNAVTILRFVSPAFNEKCHNLACV